MNEQIITHFLGVMQLSTLFTWDVVLCQWVTGAWYMETAWGFLSSRVKDPIFHSAFLSLKMRPPCL